MANRRPAGATAGAFRRRASVFRAAKETTRERAAQHGGRRADHAA
jgi:hypothetical protein